jgi:hypothetical protein
MGSILTPPGSPGPRRVRRKRLHAGGKVGLGDKGSNRRIRLVIDATVTAKTDMNTLPQDVCVKLERIVGVSVHGVAYAKPGGRADLGERHGS